MHALVMTTISSLGNPNFLIAFPRISSDTPLEYTYTQHVDQLSNRPRDYVES